MPYITNDPIFTNFQVNSCLYHGVCKLGVRPNRGIFTENLDLKLTCYSDECLLASDEVPIILSEDIFILDHTLISSSGGKAPRSVARKIPIPWRGEFDF